jgi:hypothetical protein
LVGFFFGSGVCQLYDAKLGKLVHTIANEKFRTNGLALIGFDNHVLALLATFDPSLSVLKCVLDAGGSWQFERAAQIKTMQSEELMDVVGNTGGVVVRSKDGKVQERERSVFIKEDSRSKSRMRGALQNSLLSRDGRYDRQKHA